MLFRSKMYDNHFTALNYAISEENSITENTPLHIHRLLTKDIEFFEKQDNSGKYRNIDVWIGHDICPSPFILPKLMEQWYQITNDLLGHNYREMISGIEVATVSHHMFECVHPFIDGNGRTGRLLFNMISRLCGEDPRIIYFDDRHIYYNEIQKFRDKFFTGTQFLVDDIYESLYLPPSLN